jgi:ribokinase
MIARVGDDAEADRARAELVAKGVDVHGVTPVPGEETGSEWMTVAAADNTIIVISGANHQWPPEGDPTDCAGADADVMLAQLEIPLDVVQRAAAVCRGRCLLNAAPAARLPDELISRCHVLIVNEHEQAVVSGSRRGEDRGPGRCEDGARRAARHKAVVTTLGEAGAIITDTDGTTTAIPAIPATVADTTGAGDTIVGVFAARLAANRALQPRSRELMTVSIRIIAHPSLRYCLMRECL